MSDKFALSLDRDDRLAEVLDAYLAAQEGGAAPNVDEFLARYPDLAGELRECLASLAFIRRAGNLPVAEDAPAEGDAAGGVLGDFRIVREVGKGGMGVVYEAEQISLRRRVALKVLPFAATMDPRHLQRFHNEAQAAACLHHTNIVPVFSVGTERGVHFYAMQFIDGQPLSDIIRQLRGLEKKAPAAREEITTAYQSSPGDGASTPPPAAEMTPLSGEGRRSRDYYRKVAELGIQAAEALDYAHQLGIVHRDIKPGNLLLDVRGSLWVTDFGLAHIQHGEASLTGTGQMVGTPRYMSPEQALAKRVPIDHRTDVYSLGVTLYELLTLRPAFTSEDRQELLRQIAFDEPSRPRRLERAIPAELEIIALKAMEKRPQDRYATAQELADDLERWLKHEPIRARRPTLVHRAAKWMRRHQTVATASAAVVLMVLILAGYIGWVRYDRSLRREASAEVILTALQDSQEWQDKRRLPEALSAARRAAGVLTGVDVDETLHKRVQTRLDDLELLDRLESVRLENGTAVQDGRFARQEVDTLYGQIFREKGLDVEVLAAEEVGQQIGRSSVAIELAAILDHWAITRRHLRGPDASGWKHLLRVAGIADKDAWRMRMRNALEKGDERALREMAASEEVFRLAPATLVALGDALRKDKEPAGLAEAFLHEAQRRHPYDFWLNYHLWLFYMTVQPPQKDEAFGYAAVMVALRPDSPGAHLNLGRAWKDKGRLDGAIAEYREAIRIQRDYAEARINLGSVLADKGQLDEAIAEYREAIQIKPYDALAHYNLGIALYDNGHPNEAIAEYQKSIRFDNNYAPAHFNLGSVFQKIGRLDEAIVEVREAIRLQKDFAEAHDTLGLLLHDKGLLDEAIAEHREAIHLKKDFAQAHYNLGNALVDRGRPDEAIAEYREAIRRKKDFAEAHCGIGNALRNQRRIEEAIAEYREAIRIKKDYAEGHNNLGVILRDKGQLDEAIAEYREAIRIKKDYAEVYLNLGVALASKGRLEEAIAQFRNSIRIKKDYPEAHCYLAMALKQMGRLDEAIAEYREAIQIKKDYAEAHYNLGIVLNNKEQLDEAIAEYRDAIRSKKDYAEAHFNLGKLLRDRGRLDEAIAEYRETIRIKKDFPQAYCNLGDVLERKGLFGEALEYRRRGHELGSKDPRWSYPSAQWVRNCERLVELDRQLSAILSGQKQPGGNAERLALAKLCQMQCKEQYAAASRFYSEAFAEEPKLADDLKSQHRYNAACAAARAGCGQGADADKLDAGERARLRQQALDWLRVDLKVYQRDMEKIADKAGPTIAQRMQHWLQDDDFAGVRGAESLAKLLEAERKEWQTLWEEVEALRQRVTQQPKTVNSARP